MDFLLIGLSFKGIIRLGEVYIFSETKDRAYEMEPLDMAYVIQSDDEIAPALNMEIFDVMYGVYEFKKFIGYEQLTDDCYRFRMLCYEFRQRKRCVYTLYLHRVMKFCERLKIVSGRFDDQ